MLVAFFLFVALVLGGGGSPAPLPELILELLAAAVAALWILARSQSPAVDNVPQPAWLIAGLITAVPLLQLIPLPPFVWHSLPSRELERQALALIGEENSWRSWSLAPSRTLASLLSLGPPLLLLIATSALNQRERMFLITSIAVIGIATLIVGTMQMTAAPDSWVYFYGGTEARLVGFQANHNSTADVLLIALMTVPVAISYLAERRVVPSRAGLILGITFPAITLIAFGVVLTASRMGIVLLPIPVLASVWILRPWITFSARNLAVSTVILLVAALLSVLLFRENSVINSVTARFDFGEELRPQLWRDSFYVAQKYFPFGVGMGDFLPAFMADERLETIVPLLPNRAHNDFLELACEAGIFGLSALSAISIMLSIAVWSQWRASSGQSQAFVVFAASGLAILALHSLVDYPFRSMALASLGAVCGGLLLTPRLEGGPTSDTPGPGKTR